jgi:hypothetical protein
MLHRHLNHQHFSLAAIDDIIARGRKADWAALRSAAIADRNVMEKVMKVCQAYAEDIYAQRYHFWMHYAAQHIA